MGREYTLFDLAGMGHHGYRARRLITLAAGFDDLGCFGGLFLCATAVRFSVILGWKFRCRFISYTG